MRRKHQNKLYVLLFVLLLVSGLLVMSGCAGTGHTRSVGCTPGHPGDICERQPGENQRPAWFYISPPGT
ncbi:MAG TPA: hypothetical protein VLX12_01745 [Syntrophorhabdales bacterium]|nr:hypothetical protein [Syntrophorhabdales bacterium]